MTAARTVSGLPDVSDQKLGFTVIGGYLGAGKTTMVNRLLADPGDRRIGVVVNDFGSVNIDASLIESHDGTTVNLANGCVCCSLGSSLMETLDELRAHRPALDHVVVEVSGVGDPHKTAQWGHTPGFELQGVVVLVDVETLAERLGDPRISDVVSTQIRGADLLVATKVDLVSSAHRDDACLRIGELSAAPLLDPHPSTELILGAAVTVAASATAAGSANAAEPSDASHAVEQLTIALDVPVDRDHVAAHLAAPPDGLLRLKGIARYDDQRLVFHVVGRRVQVVADRAWTGTDRGSVVALWVGDGDRKEMQRYLEALAPSS